jgi:hypothetical protein
MSSSRLRASLQLLLGLLLSVLCASGGTASRDPGSALSEAENVPGEGARVTAYSGGESSDDEVEQQRRHRLRSTVVLPRGGREHVEVIVARDDGRAGGQQIAAEVRPSPAVMSRIGRRAAAFS